MCMIWELKKINFWVPEGNQATGFNTRRLPVHGALLLGEFRLECKSEWVIEYEYDFSNLENILKITT